MAEWSSIRMRGFPGLVRLGLAILIWSVPSWPRIDAAESAAPGLVLDEISASAESLLARARSLLADGQWAEATEVLRRAMVEDQRLVRMPGAASGAGFVGYLPMGRYGQAQLSRWKETHPDALEAYRRTVDSLARREFEAARDQFDEPRLQAVVDRYFTSSSGDDALFWLGELALQRGDLVAARRFWEQLHPSLRMTTTQAGQLWGGYPLWPVLASPPALSGPALWLRLFESGNAGNWLVYPDTQLDLAAIRARLVVVSMLQGRWGRVAVERLWLRQQGGEAVGALGGRQAPWTQLLDELQPSITGQPARERGEAWPTFAGSATRERALPNGLELGTRPSWTMALPRQSWLDEQGRVVERRAGEEVHGLLTIYPAIQSGRVFVQPAARDGRIVARRLTDGQLLFDTFEQPEQEASAGPLVIPYPARVPRSTLTAEGPFVYGIASEAPEDDETASPGRRNRLLGWDATADGKLILDLRLEAPQWDGNWTFEGSPVTDEAALYVGLRRTDAVRSELFVACFRARDGQRLWLRSIGASSGAEGVVATATQNLLTLAGGVLYYNTNEGAVAALRARDGAWLWLTTYPRTVFQQDTRAAKKLASFRFRDLNPCLFYDDQLFVAPSDCDRIFALDSLTGQLLWSTGVEVAADATFLLGATDDHLIVSGDVLYWLERRSGRVAARFPAYSPAENGFALPEPRGAGRGIVAGEQVYWPTREAIWVFDQRLVPLPGENQGTYREPRLAKRIDLLSRGAAGGHLAYADGVLLIASPDQLLAFAAGGNVHDVAPRRPGSSPEAECGLPADRR